MRLPRLVPPPYPVTVVLEPTSQGAVSLAKSMLESAGIPYVIRHDTMEDMFGWGRLSAGVNYVTGPTRIAVNPEDAEAAKELLGDLDEVGIGRIPVAFRIIVWIACILVPLAIAIESELWVWNR